MFTTYYTECSRFSNTNHAQMWNWLLFQTEKQFLLHQRIPLCYSTLFKNQGQVINEDTPLSKVLTYELPTVSANDIPYGITPGFILLSDQSEMSLLHFDVSKPNCCPIGQYISVFIIGPSQINKRVHDMNINSILLDVSVPP